jgi:hypothetical protein
MKYHADKLRVDRSYQVGDEVLLKLQPYAQTSVVNRPYPKLTFKFFGPYRILEKTGAAAYRLDFPADSEIHNVFHVSQLKPFTPDHTPNYDEISKLVDLSAHSTVSEAILERRLIKKGNAAMQKSRGRDFRWDQ